MQVSRRAFLMIGAGAVAAKVLAPLMPLAPKPFDFSAEAFGAVSPVDAATGLHLSTPEMFKRGDIINFAGDNKTYLVTSVHGSTMHLDELHDMLCKLDVIKPKPTKPSTYPKHFRAKQRDPWFSFAS